MLEKALTGNRGYFLWIAFPSDRTRSGIFVLSETVEHWLGNNRHEQGRFVGFVHRPIYISRRCGGLCCDVGDALLPS